MGPWLKNEKVSLPITVPDLNNFQYCVIPSQKTLGQRYQHTMDMFYLVQDLVEKNDCHVKVWAKGDESTEFTE